MDDNLLQEAKKVFKLAVESGYKSALNWDEDPRFLPADSVVEQNIFLELCLMKQWLINEHNIFVSEELLDATQPWGYKLEGIKERKLSIRSNELFETSPEALFAGITHSLNFLNV